MAAADKAAAGGISGGLLAPLEGKAVFCTSPAVEPGGEISSGLLPVLEDEADGLLPVWEDGSVFCVAVPDEAGAEEISRGLSTLFEGKEDFDAAADKAGAGEISGGLLPVLEDECVFCVAVPDEAGVDEISGGLATPVAGKEAFDAAAADKAAAGGISGGLLVPPPWIIVLGAAVSGRLLAAPEDEVTFAGIAVDEGGAGEVSGGLLPPLEGDAVLGGAAVISKGLGIDGFPSAARLSSTATRGGLFNIAILCSALAFRSSTTRVTPTWV